MRAKEGGEKGKMKGQVGRMKEGRKDVTSGKMRNVTFFTYLFTILVVYIA